MLKWALIFAVISLVAGVLGFTGIAVAFLGQNNPLAIIFAAILWGVLSRGEVALQVQSSVPREFIIILRAQGVAEEYSHAYTLVTQPKHNALAVMSSDNANIYWYPKVPHEMPNGGPLSLEDIFDRGAPGPAFAFSGGVKFNGNQVELSLNLKANVDRRFSVEISHAKKVLHAMLTSSTPSTSTSDRLTRSPVDVGRFFPT